MNTRTCTLAFALLATIACDRSDESGTTPRAAQTVAAPTTEALRTMSPHTTRAGTLRFSGPELRDPAAAAVLLERLRSNADAPEVRAALAEALPSTGGAFTAGALEILRHEPEARVREKLVRSLGRSDDEAAIEGIRLGLSDEVAAVRAEAARAAARHPHGAASLPGLRALLSDADDTVTLAAVKAIGALRSSDPDTKAEVAALLGDTRVDVRLAALRTLARVDASYARTRPELAQLRQDSDPRIAELARTL